MSRRSDLVGVRACELEPGRRVRMPRTRHLVEVISVTEDEHGTCIIDTELGAYPCQASTLIDAEDDT